MVLTKIFKNVLDPAFHSRSHGLDTKGFSTTPLVSILENIQRLYGKPCYQELDAALIRLNNPMNQIQPDKVVLRRIEEVQLFLLSNPDKERTLMEPNLIIYKIIKLTKAGGVYAKGIER